MMTPKMSLARRPAYGLAPSLLRNVLLARLGRLREGELAIIDAHGRVLLGQPAADGLRAQITVHAERFWQRVASGGTLAAADAFIDGDWSADDLTAVMRLLVRNRDAMTGLEGGLAWLWRKVDHARHLLRPNTRGGSKKNIAAHYDLGDDLFALMLDPTMSYSCGIFERPDATLEEASLAKIDRLIAKLDLRPEHHLVEIGTGWGALAVRAAQTTGCRVTTTTISTAQHERATERVAEAGLADRITVLLEDYRDLRGQYDRLVSVEMIEAIGATQYREFFQVCERLVGPAGLVAVQAITVPDASYEEARDDVDFIKARIFPGTCIPSLNALLDAATRAGQLRLHHMEDIGLHYARTLALWRRNLEQHEAEIVRARGERFWRAFVYYLCYCEGGYRERFLGDVQLVLRGPRAMPPLNLPPLVEDPRIDA